MNQYYPFVVNMEERKDLNAGDSQSFQNLFKAYDIDGTGKVDKNALKEAVSSIENQEGRRSLLSQVEETPDKLDFNSFVNIFRGVAVSESVKKELISKAGKITQVLKGEVGYHTYSDDEKAVFANIISNSLMIFKINYLSFLDFHQL